MPWPPFYWEGSSRSQKTGFSTPGIGATKCSQVWQTSTAKTTLPPSEAHAVHLALSVGVNTQLRKHHLCFLVSRASLGREWWVWTWAVDHSALTLPKSSVCSALPSPISIPTESFAHSHTCTSTQTRQTKCPLLGWCKQGNIAITNGPMQSSGFLCHPSRPRS